MKMIVSIAFALMCYSVSSANDQRCINNEFNLNSSSFLENVRGARNIYLTFGESIIDSEAGQYIEVNFEISSILFGEASIRNVKVCGVFGGNEPFSDPYMVYLPEIERRLISDDNTRLGLGRVYCRDEVTSAIWGRESENCAVLPTIYPNTPYVIIESDNYNASSIHPVPIISLSIYLDYITSIILDIQ